MKNSYESFWQFYPDYLQEHKDKRCRALHYVGSTLVLLELLAWMVTGHISYLIAMPLTGYGFAWVGHFVFERNRPATFRYPFYSLMGDWVMFFQAVTNRLRVPK
ncbi:Mpo1-like protein [Paraferrimonas haliotis]|uniref:Membrane protein n=1 Tax=Paraferrimonas haliotis TaxID=2013866 RepID=A0AA37TWB5_9GAMM|nr:Mpo1-like protein [Paraferrimonas haliotis]GLS82736.1 membrane protein [Paraferrimonas haliotis]